LDLRLKRARGALLTARCAIALPKHPIGAPRWAQRYVSLRHAEAFVPAAGSALFRLVQELQIYEKIRKRV
jgi:hypothetical protein